MSQLQPIPDDFRASLLDCADYLRVIAKYLEATAPVAALKVSSAAREIELRINTLEAMR